MAGGRKGGSRRKMALFRVVSPFARVGMVVCDAGLAYFLAGVLACWRASVLVCWCAGVLV